MNNFLHFQLNFDPKNYFQNMRNSDDFHLSKILHMLRKPVDKHKYVYCMCEYLILISCGWLSFLENSQYIIGGNIRKKKFKISGWLLISIHVREKSEMESGRVDGGGGGGGGGGAQNREPTLSDILVGTFFQNNAYCVLSPLPPSPLPKLLNNSVSIPSCRPTLRGAGKAVLVFQQVCPRV